MRLSIPSHLFYSLLILAVWPQISQGQQFRPQKEQGVLINNVRLQNLSSINSADQEFNPMIYGNGLVYVSRFKSGPLNPETGETYFKLFYASLDPTAILADLPFLVSN